VVKQEGNGGLACTKPAAKGQGADIGAFKRDGSRYVAPQLP
jgi:hypothetical protein